MRIMVTGYALLTSFPSRSVSIMEPTPVSAPELIPPYDITIHLEREPVPIICMSSFFTMLNLLTLAD